jgi:RNA polymerase sigma factor (sigma-70 family)
MPDFARVYDEQIWHVYGFFAYRAGTRAEAEDLTQVTFERALRAWSRYDPSRAQPGTWLMAIARNVMIDHLRRDRGRVHEPLSDEPEGDARLPAVPGPEQRLGLDPALAAALARLGPREREILALRFGGDLRGPEIAELLGLTLANVQQILSRTLRRLREELERRPGEVAQLANGPAPASPAAATSSRATPEPP